jgi:hypothetical protein
MIAGSTGIGAARSAALVRLGMTRAPAPVKAALSAEGADALCGMLDEVAAPAKAWRPIPSGPPPGACRPIPGQSRNAIRGRCDTRIIVHYFEWSKNVRHAVYGLLLTLAISCGVVLRL